VEIEVYQFEYIFDLISFAFKRLLT